VKTPPSNGPITDEKPKTAAKLAWKRGRLCRGTTCRMIMIPPFMIPAQPRPAMALPTMKTGEDLATAQMSDPTSKSRTQLR